MKIGSDISISISSQLDQTSRAIARALERLSTGKRVNSPSDGVGDYSTLLKLDSQIRGLSQANLNINQVQGLLGVADAAISSQIDLVQRMRDLAVQGSNSLLSSADREALTSELISLREEFNRISQSTQFAGQSLIDGSFIDREIDLNGSGSNVEIVTPDLSLNEAFQKTIGTGSFGDSVSFGSLSGIDEMEVGDFNNDGITDIVGVGQNSETVGILIGNGDATFRALDNISVQGAFGVGVGDFNRDGIEDLAVSDAGGGLAVSVLIGNGDGTFQNAGTIFGGDLPADVVVGDINNDGVSDIVSHGFNDGVSIVYLGNGDGSFQQTQTIQVTDGGFENELADVNNNGVLDYISTSQGGYLSVSLGNGDGTFQAQTTFSGASIIEDFNVGDLNGDGYLDLVTTGEDVGINLGNGDGTFASVTTLSIGSEEVAVDIADVNGDGVLDILATDNSQDAITVLIGNGDGSFSVGSSFATGDNTRALIALDFNADGVVDIASANDLDNDVSILIGQSTQTSAVADIEVLSFESAQSLIGILDNTIERLIEFRSDISSQLSRLNIAQSTNLLQQESLTEAKASIEAADFAIETAELVSQQILQQAQIAALSQANSQLSIVLGLLDL